MDIATIYTEHYLPEKETWRAPSTVAGYDSSVRLHVLPHWGSLEIEERSGSCVGIPYPNNF